MKVITKFYVDKLCWDVVDKILNTNNSRTYDNDLIFRNNGSMIIIAKFATYDRISIQIGSWTLQYDIK